MKQDSKNPLMMLKEAIPSSGKPETPEDWERLQIAFEALAVKIYCVGGMPIEEATRLAKITHGGEAGRLLIEIGLEIS